MEAFVVVLVHFIKTLLTKIVYLVTTLVSNAQPIPNAQPAMQQISDMQSFHFHSAPVWTDTTIMAYLNCVILVILDV